MTDQEVMAKAIDQARDNGWRLPGNWTSRDEFITYELNPDCPDKWHKFKSMALLLDKDFARALWGESGPTLYDVFPDKKGEYPVRRKYGWRWHLQNMVISDDPIKYLGEHLDA